MRLSPKWANYIVFIVASAKAVCAGNILHAHQQRAMQLTEQIQASPSFYYHYQQHRGQPAQQIHVEFPRQTRISSPPQAFTTARPNNRFTLKPLETPNSTPSPSPYVEYPVDDTEERKNTSNKLYFEDHNGNGTHREHHYRHVTVNHFYYNATNATDDATNKGKDVKHHYYYNEYKHDHRNKTNDPNVKHYYNEYKHDHRNKTNDPNVKHYYNEYKHDHRNKTNDPNVKHHYYYNDYEHDHRNKTDANSQVKHHYYYNDYKHDHRNKTDDPNAKHYYYNDYKHDHRNKMDANSQVKHHYYYNDYKHDHRNKSDDPNVNHYYNNDYRHDHRNTTDDPNAKHYYYYNDHRNKTEGDSVKHYYYNTYRNITDTPNVKHYYHKHDNITSGPYNDYDDASVSEENSSKKEDLPITDAQGIEDYEYVTPDPKPIVKHHHFFKEYHYKNGRLISNTTNTEPPRGRPYSNSEPYTPVHSFGSAKPGRLVGFPVIPVVKQPSYDKRFGYLGGSGYPFFGFVKPQDPTTRNKNTPNGPLGYYLVDPLGRLPTLRIHGSVLGFSPERTSRRVHGYVLDNPYPEAVSYHHVTRLQPVRRRALPRSEQHSHETETFPDRYIQVEAFAE